MLILTCKNQEELRIVAENLLKIFPEDRFFAFFGKMGAGKTTLIKSICSKLNVSDNVCSPTFSIVNEYSNEEGRLIYHFDFYRLENIEEAYDLGYEEYFYSGNYCFVEWSEKIEAILPRSYVRVEIVEKEEKQREFIITKITE